MPVQFQYHYPYSSPFGGVRRHEGGNQRDPARTLPPLHTATHIHTLALSMCVDKTEHVNAHLDGMAVHCWTVTEPRNQSPGGRMPPTPRMAWHGMAPHRIASLQSSQSLLSSQLHHRPGRSHTPRDTLPGRLGRQRLGSERGKTVRRGGGRISGWPIVSSTESVDGARASKSPRAGHLASRKDPDHAPPRRPPCELPACQRCVARWRAILLAVWVPGRLQGWSFWCLVSSI
jgi:hypothetical protein